MRWDNSKCVCVHSDAIECARRRDGLETDDTIGRECECSCHEEGEDDWDDDWVNPTKSKQ